MNYSVEVFVAKRPYPYYPLLSPFLLPPFVIQYVNKATSALRGALKEPIQQKAMAQESFFYKSSSWQAGEQGVKKEVTSLKEVGGV